MDRSQHYNLRWNNHQSHLLAAFDALLQNESLVDCTIMCEDAAVRAHKVVLSACSPYFQNIFIDNPGKHPIIVVKDIHCWEMQCILDFMYKGETSVPEPSLTTLIQAAESLQVRGLTSSDHLPPPGVSLTSSPTNLSSSNSAGGGSVAGSSSSVSGGAAGAPGGGSVGAGGGSSSSSSNNNNGSSSVSGFRSYTPSPSPSSSSHHHHHHLSPHHHPLHPHHHSSPHHMPPHHPPPPHHSSSTSSSSSHHPHHRYTSEPLPKMSHLSGGGGGGGGAGDPPSSESSPMSLTHQDQMSDRASGRASPVPGSGGSSSTCPRRKQARPRRRSGDSVNSSLDLSKAGSPPLLSSSISSYPTKRESPGGSVEDHPENLSMRRSHSPGHAPAINLVKMEQLVEGSRIESDNISEMSSGDRDVDTKPIIPDGGMERPVLSNGIHHIQEQEALQALNFMASGGGLPHHLLPPPPTSLHSPLHHPGLPPPPHHFPPLSLHGQTKMPPGGPGSSFPGRGPKGQHSAPRGGPPRSWTNDDLTKALENVWNKRMTTSQASRIFGIPYNSLLMYVRGKYGKSLRLDVLKKNTPAANDNLNTIGNSRSTPKEKGLKKEEREAKRAAREARENSLGREDWMKERSRKSSHASSEGGGGGGSGGHLPPLFNFDPPSGLHPFGGGLLPFPHGLGEPLGLLGLGIPPTAPSEMRRRMSVSGKFAFWDQDRGAESRIKDLMQSLHSQKAALSQSENGGNGPKEGAGLELPPHLIPPFFSPPLAPRLLPPPPPPPQVPAEEGEKPKKPQEAQEPEPQVQQESDPEVQLEPELPQTVPLVPGPPLGPEEIKKRNFSLASLLFRAQDMVVTDYQRHAASLGLLDHLPTIEALRREVAKAAGDSVGNQEEAAEAESSKAEPKSNGKKSSHILEEGLIEEGMEEPEEDDEEDEEEEEEEEEEEDEEDLEEEDPGRPGEHEESEEEIPQIEIEPLVGEGKGTAGTDLGKSLGSNLPPTTTQISAQ